MIASKESRSNYSVQRTQKTTSLFVLALARHFCTKFASIFRAADLQRYAAANLR